MAYRVACSSAARCSLHFAKGVDSNIALHAWFEAAQAGEPSAKRDFSVTVFNNVGAPVLRYFVTNGLPTSYVENGRRVAVGFDADRIQRVAV